MSWGSAEIRRRTTVTARKGHLVCMAEVVAPPEAEVVVGELWKLQVYHDRFVGHSNATVPKMSVFRRGLSLTPVETRSWHF